MIKLIIFGFLALLNIYIIMHTAYRKSEDENIFMKKYNNAVLWCIFSICSAAGLIWGINIAILLYILFFIGYCIVFTMCNTCPAKTTCTTCPYLMFNGNNIFDKIIIYCLNKTNIVYTHFKK